MDSSAPYYVSAVDKYLCTMKLIDSTVNPEEAVGGKPSFISVTFFSKLKKEIPQPTKMGTIIRIHRADTRKYAKSYQLNCDIGIKGAWAIFDPTETFTPISHTGRTYTFIDADKKRIRDIRKFAEKFFKENDVTEDASIGAKKGEIDMFCQVLKRKTVEKSTDRLTVFDGDSFSKMDIPKDRYTHIAPNDYVRIRGVGKKSGNFLINEYTNVLKISKDHSSAEELRKKIEKAKKNKNISEKLEMYIPVVEKSRVITDVSDKKLKVISLSDLFSTDSAKLKDKKYRVNVSVIEMGPKDPSSWIVPVDAKARKQYNIPEKVTHYYKLQLFTKDATTPEDPNIYTLYLCTIDGKGEEFLPPPPSAKGKKEEPKELKKIYKMLTKPWVTLDLTLEGVPVSGGTPVFFIVDTKLNL